jgi:hypothetical protein
MQGLSALQHCIQAPQVASISKYDMADTIVSCCDPAVALSSRARFQIVMGTADELAPDVLLHMLLGFYPITYLHIDVILLFRYVTLCSDSEFKGSWARFHIDMGTADELALDVLLHMLLGFYPITYLHTDVILLFRYVTFCSDPEFKGSWARFHVDMGTADELALDVLLNMLLGFSAEVAGISRIRVGGEHERWALPGDEADGEEGEASQRRRKEQQGDVPKVTREWDTSSCAACCVGSNGVRQPVLSWVRVSVSRGGRHQRHTSWERTQALSCTLAWAQ